MECRDFHHGGRQRRKLVLEGRISIKSFLLGLSVLMIPITRAFLGHLFDRAAFDHLTGSPGKAVICVHIAAVNGLLLLAYRGGRGPLYEVAVRACFLGAAFGCGLIVSFSSRTAWTRFGWYVCSLSFFHYSEFLATAVVNPHGLSADSFLLNHSAEYGLAAAASWLEFAAEWWFVGASELKRRLDWLSAAGLAMALCGDGLRKAAMLTAGSNFNHVVQNKKAHGHVLVTAGVYARVRHPAYAGWFLWSVGTQVMLVNPVCALGYALAGWLYFRERVEEEELALVDFFGEDYVEYKKRVPTGLPFIPGIRVN